MTQTGFKEPEALAVIGTSCTREELVGEPAYLLL